MRALLRDFFKLESSGGIFLFLMALLAMAWANSPIAPLRDKFVDLTLFWINDGLMAIFFLLVGLELKRGVIEGELSSLKQVMLPAVAALGGMIVPALIYAYCNLGDTLALRGWATPVATDIAFAIGVLTIFGRKVPSALKIFLLALAIFDDIGAILIIVFFFSKGLSILHMVQATFIVFLLWLINRKGVRHLAPYLILGVWLWLCLLYSGIHPTIAGVILAMTIPDGAHKGPSPLRTLEKTIHPWVVYFVMPLFALANAGFPLSGITWATLTDGVVLGIVFGLFLGKPIGVMLFSWLAVKLKAAKLPGSICWSQVFGVSLLCGIGFTMSLFLGTLSFQNETTYLLEVRLGVVSGSLLSGLLGAYCLQQAFKKKAS